MLNTFYFYFNYFNILIICVVRSKYYIILYIIIAQIEEVGRTPSNCLCITMINYYMRLTYVFVYLF